MKRDRNTLAVVLGIAFLVLGIVLLVFSIVSFIGLVSNPTSSLRPQTGPTDLLPVASGILTVTMYIVMAYTGVLLVRTGYHLLWPQGQALAVRATPDEPEARAGKVRPF